jgi:hypothetical protein
VRISFVDLSMFMLGSHYFLSLWLDAVALMGATEGMIFMISKSWDPFFHET